MDQHNTSADVARLRAERDDARADAERAQRLAARLAELLGRVSAAIDELAPLDDGAESGESAKDTPLDDRVRIALLGAEESRIRANVAELERDRWKIAANRDAAELAALRK